MRLWSLHPDLLDGRGLTALWREGLLALKVLKGNTRGYRHHPQLIRFRGRPDPCRALRDYLSFVEASARARGYCFRKSRIRGAKKRRGVLTVTRGQIDFELKHLKRKLKERDPAGYRRISRPGRVRVHPYFRVVRGPREAWEKAGKPE